MTTSQNIREVIAAVVIAVFFVNRCESIQVKSIDPSICVNIKDGFRIISGKWAASLRQPESSKIYAIQHIVAIAVKLSPAERIKERNNGQLISGHRDATAAIDGAPDRVAFVLKRAPAAAPAAAPPAPATAAAAAAACS